MELPRRTSLVTETVQVLRAALARGEWNGRLPGERGLCVQLHVSRSTLRQALALLQREGVLAVQPGRARRVRAARRNPRRRARSILLLSLQPMALQQPATACYLQALQTQLQGAGLALEIRSEPGLGRRPEPLLELLASTEPAAWLLLSLPAPVQAWCAARALPALVIGSCHAGVRLPSFQLDLGAVCRHATGLLRARGHRSLALVRPRVLTAGMQASEHGFLAGAGDARTRILTHDGDPDTLARTLDRALAGAHPPTGLLVCHAAHALGAASHLIARGRRLPRDLSLISRDHDEPLAFFRPALTRYDHDKDVFARRLARLAVRLAGQGGLPARDYRTTPRFIPGATLGPAPVS
ncbi:MAG: substrate-binding domain-containing protein [Opitutaceae bacterium]|nr:substrate-binding domain-containing protein [Opitutaceae bacterium]